MATIQNLLVDMDIELNFSCGMLHLYSKFKSLSSFMPLYLSAVPCFSSVVTSTFLLLVPFNDDLFVSVPSSLEVFILI